MRKILIILIFFSLTISCSNKENSNNVKTILKVDLNEIKKKEAITILNNVNNWMEKAVRKEISKNKVNKEINPLMEKYQKLLKDMNKQDSTEIQDYRIKKINELIDLQIQQNSKN